MHKGKINYFTENIVFALQKKMLVTSWIQEIITQEKSVLGYLNFIFCSDPYLLAHNVQYLNHDTLTDVITFDYSESCHLIEGEVYISIERVCENATTYQVSFIQELHRVIAHGVLHLLGYKDKTDTQKAEIRKKEDFYLLQRHSKLNG
jgi:probable rRNA maturation factor